MTTYPQIPLIAIHNFQHSTINLAKEAIDRFALNERNISTVTLSVSHEAFEEIEEKLAIFRRDVQRLVENDKHQVNRVYQFNFQIFPLSHRLGNI